MYRCEISSQKVGPCETVPLHAAPHHRRKSLHRFPKHFGCTNSIDRVVVLLHDSDCMHQRVIWHSSPRIQLLMSHHQTLKLSYTCFNETEIHSDGPSNSEKSSNRLQYIIWPWASFHIHTKCWKTFLKPFLNHSQQRTQDWKVDIKMQPTDLVTTYTRQGNYHPVRNLSRVSRESLGLPSLRQVGFLIENFHRFWKRAFSVS